MRRKRAKLSARFFAGFAISVAFLVAGCNQKTDPSVDAFRCLNHDQLPHEGSGKEIVKIGRTSQALTAAYGKVFWDRPDHAIPICWEPSTYREEDQAYRDLVKKTVEGTWGEALKFPPVPENEWVHFTGWGKCADGDKDSVRISANDEETHVFHLGKNLAGKPGGVNLNCTFRNWGPSCARDPGSKEKCVREGAAHEFGHVLGFTHEQNRPDKTEAEQLACEKSPDPQKGGITGTVGTLFFGAYDVDSIMNYCNPKKNNGGVLSPFDIVGVRAAYYHRYFDFECLEKVKTQALAAQEFNARSSVKVDSDQNVKPEAAPASGTSGSETPSAKPLK